MSQRIPVTELTPDFRGRAEAVLEIGAHRELGRSGDLASVFERLLARDATVAPAPRVREARTRRRERREAERREDAGGADVPRIRDDEG